MKAKKTKPPMSYGKNANVVGSRARPGLAKSGSKSKGKGKGKY